MIQWVYEQARKAALLSRVLVAADDPRIAAAVEFFGGEVVMTSPTHPSGTDRLAEVAASLPGVDLVVNIQGDEPLIAPESIDLAVERLQVEPRASISTLASPCSPEDRASPNVVKVVLDVEGFALYFSRSPIPHLAANSAGGMAGHPALKHIGLYVYRRDFLLAFAQMERTPLEKAEALEQLRALEHGYRIVCAMSPYNSIGVDTLEDLRRVEEAIRARSNVGSTG